MRAPAIASDIPGYREVMTPETGVSVPPGDPEALAQAVIGMLEDEERRRALGTAARELAAASTGGTGSRSGCSGSTSSSPGRLA